jgi:AbiV family abortive infection protein
MNVTPHFLLEGSIHALKQCGHLLESAGHLYNAGDYSSSVILAAFAREELGRFRILKDLHKRAVGNGETVSLDRLQKECEDHVNKQKWAQISVIQTVNEGEGLGKLIKEYAKGPSSKEFTEAPEKLEAITKRQTDRIPEDRHRERMKALYVQPNTTGTTWSLPWDYNKGEAHKFIQHAISDYAFQIDKFKSPAILRLNAPGFAQAYEEWADKPTLPGIPGLI